MIQSLEFNNMGVIMIWTFYIIITINLLIFYNLKKLSI